MDNNILLLGPMCSGKTTIARRLARTLHIPNINLDQEKWHHFDRLGFDNAAEEKAHKNDGIRGLYTYHKEFEFPTLVQTLSQKGNYIYDIGAGFVIYDDFEKQQYILSMLTKFQNTFILLPHPSFKTSLKTLAKRFIKRFKKDIELEQILNSTPNFDLNYNFLEFYFNQTDSFKVIYTYRKSIKDIIKEIIRRSNIAF